ncbi:hypothetical protein [Brevibacterium aurantiacum]|uniref:hypothetical protein n=1 Tax=Brevibacterium aurantiacum TaxID=273384 RepID=UPI001436BC81|nr:hypothetical protein [Brevibacterium aurantiacum]
MLVDLVPVATVLPAAQTMMPAILSPSVVGRSHHPAVLLERTSSVLHSFSVNS